MTLLKYLDKKIKHYKWYDIGFIKAAVFFFTLFLMTVWNGFSNFIFNYNWKWYLVLAIIFSIFAMNKMFEK